MAYIKDDDGIPKAPKHVLPFEMDDMKIADYCFQMRILRCL